ncbi:MAG: phospho-sugar mutase [Christensenellaceae bacterium]|jgi:phosphoglucomutase|nr:phospho-sugar mutase [Christensenellaceae bacterium]
MVLDTYTHWLSCVNDDEKAELIAIKDNIVEINERFSQELAFGTAGMRGEVGLGLFRMNVYTVRWATAGLAGFIASFGEDYKKRGVVIAYDTRRFSREFAFAAAETLASFCINSLIFEDTRPVPMCSFAVRHYNAAAGIMITASHNPKEYNGYKVYGEDGAQMSTDSTQAVVNYISQIKDYFSIKHITISDIESCRGKDNFPLNDYVVVIGKSLDVAYFDVIEKLSLSPELVSKYGNELKLVYTPIHGSGYMPVTTILKRLGISVEIVPEQILPDTEFSTVDVPNPENPNTMKLSVSLAEKIGAEVALATDPDADRLGVAVKNDSGNFVLLSGNLIGVLLLDYILSRLVESNSLPKNAAVIRSIVSTTLADRIARSYNVPCFSVLTGFKYIGEKIKEWEASGEYTYVFGFEESYGSLCGTHARDKDAVVGAMLFAEMLIYYKHLNKSIFARLNEIYSKFGYYTEKNISISYKGISAMSDMKAVMNNLRKDKITKIASEKVVSISDYLLNTKYIVPTNSTIPINSPKSDVLYIELPNEQFVCIRPSGTEPKLKIYALVCASSDLESQSKANIIAAEIEKLCSVV